ncbi:hypothetical protein EDD28_0349 [Salana multivorans]|uniref:Histone acetyltransferase Rv0428c-like SH3 domain-containing protein n=1 Tax=Salana multivorans TaxID=120377 RepID=A0A3N2D7N1_9MICO|nr:hypothetical protein [Salana multivorans]ROR95787.1 hypothetical protein EDD28_0349 [Salana multivorans]
MERLQLGERVVIRYRLPNDTSDGLGPSLSDALGRLVELRPDAVVVQTRRGPVTIPHDAILLVKRVPPPPPPRGRTRPVDPPRPLA